MANIAARTLSRLPEPATYEFYGGFATISDTKKEKNKDLFNGPNWFVENMKNVY